MDALDLSRMEDGSLELEGKAFVLTIDFKEVKKLVAPITSVKMLRTEISLATDRPEYVVGDERRLKQTVLIVVGNAVKLMTEGSVSIRVLPEREIGLNVNKQIYVLKGFSVTEGLQPVT